jgi:ABC-type Zn2+ transport system substrate-binding protein/surface adhesin
VSYGNDHDHRGEYASDRHDHDNDYAEKHHRHYNDEREVTSLGGRVNNLETYQTELYGRVEALEREQRAATCALKSDAAKQLFADLVELADLIGRTAATVRERLEAVGEFPPISEEAYFEQLERREES